MAPEHQMHRVKAGSGDYVYQPSLDYDPDKVAFCPHCWDRKRIKVPLPTPGNDGCVLCYSCKCLTQLHPPIDFDSFYSAE